MKLWEFFDDRAGGDDDEEMRKNIGRTVRFNIPSDPRLRKKFLKDRGTISLELHEITDVQSNYAGNACYIVKTVGWREAEKTATPWRADQGRFASPSELHFADK
jgi:hypothetical protein